MSFQDEIVEKILVPPHNLDNDLSEHILDILKKITLINVLNKDIL